MVVKKITVKKAASKPKSIDALRDALREFRAQRELAKQIDAEVKDQQPVLITTLLDAGATGKVGVSFTTDEGEALAGFVQQNDPAVYWDQEALIEWLRTEKLWMQCSIRVLDQSRFEDLIARGIIPARKVQKFKKTGDAPKPFIRFGKPTDESL